MRHANSTDLARLTPVIDALRALPVLTERRPGVFYMRSKAFLHFHEDDGSLFVDVRIPPATAFSRERVTTRAEQRELVRHVRAACRTTR